MQRARVRLRVLTGLRLAGRQCCGITAISFNLDPRRAD
jgi:hypothetical protein